ncbi:MAG TPA: hypothetical protein VGI75_02855, partial [Pirellulales bacterium]
LLRFTMPILSANHRRRNSFSLSTWERAGVRGLKRHRTQSARTALVLIAIILFASVVRAADPADDDDDDNPPAAQQPGQQVFVLTPENFDQWVFNGVGNSSQAFQQIDAQLNLRVEAIDRVCHLTDAQKLKLQLAANTDIKKFRDLYEQYKQKYQNTRQQQNEVNKVFQAIAPLQQQWQVGLFGDTSVFSKVLKNTLTPDQWFAYELDQAQRDKFIYKAKIRLAIQALQGAVALTDDQRKQFEKLLLDETKPPLKYSQPQYDFYLVMLQAAHLPKSELKSIFDDQQQRLLSRIFQQALGMERMFQQEGLLPNEMSPPPASPGRAHDA